MNADGTVHVWEQGGGNARVGRMAKK
jgi:hypothetical protein